MGRDLKFQTSNTHTHTAHTNSWWLVISWLTTKEYHPRLCIANSDFMVRFKYDYHIKIYIKICTTESIQRIVLVCL